MIILDSLPYADGPTTITVRGETQEVHAYQIIVWVSINIRGALDWDPRTPQLPAILDPGNNHNFSISRGQLIRWAGIQPEALRPLGTIKERGQRIRLHTAKFWLHPNVPGETQTSKREPHALDMQDGIAIFPDATGPRLPLLGLRALTTNQLQFTVDGQQRLVWLRTQNWRAKAIRFLS